MVFNVETKTAGPQGEQGRVSRGWGSGYCRIIIISHNLLPFIIMVSSAFSFFEAGVCVLSHCLLSIGRLAMKWMVRRLSPFPLKVVEAQETPLTCQELVHSVHWDLRLLGCEPAPCYWVCICKVTIVPR